VLLDSRSVPSGTTLESDVCIIGAGPAGIMIALELKGRGFRVALLDRGGPPGLPLGLRHDGVTATESDFQSPPRPPARFGGGANEWIVRLPWQQRGVRMVPLGSIDLAARPWVPHSGWPFGWDELEPWYLRAHRRLGLGRWGYGPDVWECPDRRRLPLESFGFTTAMERFPRAEVFTRQAWDELRSAPDVTVILGSPVGQLIGTDDRVEHVEIDSGCPGRLRMTARQFVLACGGLDNPRLLLTANGCKGIGEARDVVGRYYMDHLRCISGSLVPADRSMFEMTGLYDIRSTPAGLVMGKLVPTDDLLRDKRLLNSSAQLLPKPADDVVAAMDEVRSTLESLRSRRRPARLPIGAAARLALFAGRTFPEMAVRQRRMPPRTDAGWSAMKGNARRYARFDVEHQLEQAPDPDNRVRLGDQRDDFGRPTIDLRWRWSEPDLHSARATQGLFAEAVQQSGLGTFNPTDWDEHPPVTTPEGAFHPMGGTRMHTDPSRGVVDRTSRVHGVDNLHVAGSSVFPTGGYANPTFTLLALSARLAGSIVRHLTARAHVVQAATGRGSMYLAAALVSSVFS
jgi:choline dehydrogenase-like flavoprotein